MARKIFDWFSPSRGRKVIVMLEQHLRLTMDAVSNLCQMVDASAESRSNSARFYRSIDRLEKEADQLRRDMVEQLTKSEMFPEEREDLMELVRAVDWIADWSKEAGRILMIIPFDKVHEDMSEAVSNMCKANTQCVRVLIESIHALLRNPEKVIELTNEVELFEEDIDDLYNISREFIAKLEFPGFTTGELILLNEFLNALETMSDWCENTADIVRAVSIRR
jgi:predicted phosphate transport protein (TIGR00153 family)